MSISDSALTVKIPDDTQPGPVTVDNAAGRAFSSVLKLFPRLDNFSPMNGKPGDVLTVTGAGFTGITSASINGSSAPFSVESSNTLKITVPNGATNGLISVSSAGGTGLSTGQFVVVYPPSISELTPSAGAVQSSIVINGRGLSGASAVTFSNEVGATYAVKSDTQLTATVPAGAASGPVRVTTPGGTFTSIDSFAVLPDKVVFDPSSSTSFLPSRCTSKMTLSAVDPDGSGRMPSSPLLITLTEIPANLAYSDANCTKPITSVTITTKSAAFYLKGPSSSMTLSVSADCSKDIPACKGATHKLSRQS